MIFKSNWTWMWIFGYLFLGWISASVADVLYKTNQTFRNRCFVDDGKNPKWIFFWASPLAITVSLLVCFGCFIKTRTIKLVNGFSDLILNLVVCPSCSNKLKCLTKSTANCEKDN